MSGLPHSLTLTAHFCPRCGEQCSCQDALVYDAEDETMVEGCVHHCDGNIPVCPVHGTQMTVPLSADGERFLPPWCPQCSWELVPK